MLEQVAEPVSELAREKDVVDGLDERIQPLVRTVDVHARERLARRRLPHPLDERHARALAHERRIFQRVVEHHGRHPEKCLPGNIAIEVDPQPRLDGAAGRKPTHAHADVAHTNAAPLEIGRNVDVFEVPLPKLTKIARVNVQANVVQRPAVEELVGRLRAGDSRTQQQHEQQHTNHALTLKA